jgi:hypothetical protein
VRVIRLCVLVFACLAAAQPDPLSPDPATPTGHWVAERPSNGGIGSWWDFRSDGTLTLHFGAMVTTPVKRAGDVLTMPSATVSGPPGEVSFHVEGDTLRLSAANGQELKYTRIGEPPSPSDPLLGKWRPVQPATPSADPNRAALDKVSRDAVYVFAADGTESVRIPFGSREGTWNLAAHTFRFVNETVVYSFSFSGPKLVLGQPPDGKMTDTYLPDPLF